MKLLNQIVGNKCDVCDERRLYIQIWWSVLLYRVCITEHFYSISEEFKPAKSQKCTMKNIILIDARCFKINGAGLKSATLRFLYNLYNTTMYDV